MTVRESDSIGNITEGNIHGQPENVSDGTD